MRIFLVFFFTGLLGYLASPVLFCAGIFWPCRGRVHRNLSRERAPGKGVTKNRNLAVSCMMYSFNSYFRTFGMYKLEQDSSKLCTSESDRLRSYALRCKEIDSFAFVDIEGIPAWFFHCKAGCPAANEEVRRVLARVDEGM